MEKSRTDQILKKLENMIENAQSMPLSSGRIVVSKDEISLLISELKLVVEGELKQYRETNDKRAKIINEAKKEAEEIIFEAEKSASRIRVTKRNGTHKAPFKQEDLSKDEQLALRTANDIYAASLIYTDEMLTEVNDVVAEAYDLMANEYDKIIKNLEEKAKIIARNKSELMKNLKDLSNDERYAQILELSQLLSNELYNERSKAKELEKRQEKVRLEKQERDKKLKEKRQQEKKKEDKNEEV